MSAPAPLLGQFDVTRAALLRGVAGKLRRAASPASGAGVIPTMRQARVTATTTGPPKTVAVTFDGGVTVLPSVRYLDSYTPGVGDVVEVLVRSGNPYVLGVLA